MLWVLHALDSARRLQRVAQQEDAICVPLSVSLIDPSLKRQTGGIVFDSPPLCFFHILSDTACYMSLHESIGRDGGVYLYEPSLVQKLPSIDPNREREEGIQPFYHYDPVLRQDREGVRTGILDGVIEGRGSDGGSSCAG